MDLWWEFQSYNYDFDRFRPFFYSVYCNKRLLTDCCVSDCFVFKIFWLYLQHFMRTYSWCRICVLLHYNLPSVLSYISIHNGDSPFVLLGFRNCAFNKAPHLLYTTLESKFKGRINLTNCFFKFLTLHPGTCPVRVEGTGLSVKCMIFWHLFWAMANPGVDDGWDWSNGTEMISTANPRKLEESRVRV